MSPISSWRCLYDTPNTYLKQTNCLKVKYSGLELSVEADIRVDKFNDSTDSSRATAWLSCTCCALSKCLMYHTNVTSSIWVTSTSFMSFLSVDISNDPSDPPTLDSTDSSRATTWLSNTLFALSKCLMYQTNIPSSLWVTSTSFMLVLSVEIPLLLGIFLPSLIQ